MISGWMIAAGEATAGSSSVPSVLLAALGVALSGGIVALVSARVNRKPVEESSAGTLASGAADLVEQSLALLATSNQAAAKMAAGLEAERDACQEDRVVLLSVVEGEPIDPEALAALRARVVA